MAIAAMASPTAAQPSSFPRGYGESIVFNGLDLPTAVRFSPDGRVFVAEKSGRILVFSSLTDSTPTVFADLSTKVHNFWDRGLLGMELAPGFPSNPYVYAFYTHDAAVGGTAPLWGTPGVLNDPCPTPPGPTQNGCVVSGRLSRLQAEGDSMVGSEHVLVEGWCQQFPSHSVGDIRFGPDGALYASAGDGASFGFADYGQSGDPLNPCGDPPVGVGGSQTPPPAEGGALRSQDLRTTSDPGGLNGSIIRVDPTSGEGLPTNPRAFDPDPNVRRVIAYGFRNPFRFTFRPGTGEMWIGDVGWNSGDEIDLLPSTTPAVKNFGWPCYEGLARQTGYDVLNLNLCEILYASSGAVTPPLYSYPWNGHIVPNDAGCYEGGSAIAGLAFYTGKSYPGKGGTLFVADNSRRCIWTIAPGANGAPDVSRRAIFGTDLGGPVDLEIGPEGDVYYVDVFGGTVRRILWVGGDPPTAVATATPASGPLPLTVQFDGSGSTDPEDDLEDLSFRWDFENDGRFDSYEQAAEHTYEEIGTYTARLRVTDSFGLSGETTVTIHAANSPPAATIDLPSAGTSWRVGQVINFAGSADDHDEGQLPDSALSWDLILHHCRVGCHQHLVEGFDGGGGSFVAPDHEYPSFLELKLTAEDAHGAFDTDSLELHPETVDLSFASQPTGLELVVGADSGIAPFVKRVIVGSANSVTAPSPQTVDGVQWLFSLWSNAGNRSQLVTAPESPTTYTAHFTRPAPPPGPQPPPPPPAPPPPPPPLPPAPPPPPPPRPPQPQPVLPLALHCLVPRVVGLSLTKARRSLTRRHCGLGRVTWVYSRTSKGLVRTQRPKTGSRLPKGTKVALSVSRGPRAKA